MAAPLFIEEETGTFTGRHPHNGYYAGDFSSDFSADTRPVDQAAAILALPVGFGAVGIAA